MSASHAGTAPGRRGVANGPLASGCSRGAKKFSVSPPRLLRGDLQLSLGVPAPDLRPVRRRPPVLSAAFESPLGLPRPAGWWSAGWTAEGRVQLVRSLRLRAGTASGTPWRVTLVTFSRAAGWRSFLLKPVRPATGSRPRCNRVGWGPVFRKKNSVNKHRKIFPR